MADRINTELAIVGKHGINAMMVPRFSSESSVAEVEEQIKVDDIMEVDTITWYNKLSVTCLQATIREAHEEAVQKVLAAFNSMVVGTGSVRQRCEKHLHTFLRKELEIYTLTAEALSNGQKFKEEDYTMFYGPVCYTNLLVVEAQVDLAFDGTLSRVVKIKLLLVICTILEFNESSPHTFIVYVRYDFLSGFSVTSLSVKANKIKVEFDKTSMQETP
nr:guanylate-binding protein 4-like [Tanacetum cinerariifolium]